MAMTCDVLVIGGGINGAGIARDAAGRGLSVVLCEKDDLASHTSSASSKLIHGGLRYLEQLEFGLVRKALTEREILLRAAPHLIQPLRFVMPHVAQQRPAWLIQLGLFLYDHLARRAVLPASGRIRLPQHAAGQPLKPQFATGFEYSDAFADDARLVVTNALDAALRGATILTRTSFSKAIAHDGNWFVELTQADGRSFAVRARCLVNASGCWSADLHRSITGSRSTSALRLVKGSHIVVKRLFDHSYAYLFQHPDGRIVFSIPYEQKFTLIGTTDTVYAGDPDAVTAGQDEIRYLCDLSNRYFQQPISPADVLWSYSGVRALLDSPDATSNAAAMTRDFRLHLEQAPLPLLSVFGGKITTYRKLAEQALEKLRPLFPSAGPAWTAHAVLPGADFTVAAPGLPPGTTCEQFAEQMLQRYDWLPAALVLRFARAYGSRLLLLLDGRTCIRDMGDEILPGLFEAEVEYWMQHEWALTAEDMLWRRSKLGLHLPQDCCAKLAAWLQRQKLKSLFG